MAWPTLVTDRLVLRPLAATDLDDLAALHAEESFWWYPFGRGWSRAETESFLDRTIERYQDPGIAVSAVEIADTAQLFATGSRSSASRRSSASMSPRTSPRGP